jgi:hypothetical protein
MPGPVAIIVGVPLVLLASATTLPSTPRRRGAHAVPGRG